MDGNNAKYRADCVKFLNAFVLHPDPSWRSSGGIEDARDLITGIHAFDILSPDSYSSIHQLKFWDRGAQTLHGSFVDWENGYKKKMTAGPKPTFWQQMWGDTGRRSDEGPLMAYWLPFRMNTTFEMDLDKGANGPQFFFTAGLSGCTVVVAGDPRNPHVAHINRMEGPDLNSRMQKIFADASPGIDSPYQHMPKVNIDRRTAHWPDEAKRRVLARRPDVTKAETTQRQVMLQELQAVVALRAQTGHIQNLRGDNYRVNELNPWSVSERGAVSVGGPVRQGNFYFGVCDWALHYQGATEWDCLANVCGYRQPSGNWRFLYQVLSSVKGQGIRMRTDLKCLVCKVPAEACMCPA